MHSRPLIRTAAAVTAALAIAACSRKPNAPEIQTTTGQLPQAEAVTVSGCLRSGLLGADTFVLMTAENEPARTANYQLTAPGRNLDEFVGHAVKVSGTVRAEEQFSSVGATTTADSKPVGTGGAPKVKTKTDVDVKQMTVTSIDRTGDTCAPASK